MKRRGFILLLIAVGLNVAETIYFGCNITALTPAETIMDGICAVVMLGAFILTLNDWVDYFWKKCKMTIDCAVENSEHK